MFLAFLSSLLLSSYTWGVTSLLCPPVISCLQLSLALPFSLFLQSGVLADLKQSLCDFGVRKAQSILKVEDAHAVAGHLSTWPDSEPHVTLHCRC